MLGIMFFSVVCFERIKMVNEKKNGRSKINNKEDFLIKTQ